MKASRPGPVISGASMMSTWCAGGHKDMEETSLRYTATAPRQCSGFVMQHGVLQPCECSCHSGSVIPRP